MNLVNNFKEINSKIKNSKFGFTDDLVQFKDIYYDKSSTCAIATTKNLKAGTISYFSGFKINGLDISNYSNEEKEIAYYNLSTIFKSLTSRISIVKTSKIYDLKINEEYLENKVNQINDDERINIFNSYIESLDHFKNSNYQNNYYIFVYGNSQLEVVQNLNSIIAKFECDSFGTKLLTKSEIVQVQLDILNHNSENIISDEFFVPIKNVDTDEIIQEALSFEDILAFDNIKFKKDHIEINNQSLFINIQSVDSFPLDINYHWLDCLFNTPSSCVMHIDVISREEARSKIHKSDMNLKTNFVDNQGANKLDAINLQKTYEALNDLAESVALGEEQLKQFQIFFVNSANDLEEIKRLKEINISNCSTINANINNLTYQQFEGFQNVCLKSTDNLKNYQQVPDSTLAGGWPFSNSDFNDNNGFVVGSTMDGNVIIMDQFKTDNSRTNYNMMILGSSGSGKSTFTKKLAMYHLAEGNQNIIIDPESEYKGLLKQYGGYFDGSHYVLGGDAKTKFNPLQIQQHIGEFDDEDIINSNETIIKEHIDWVGNWLSVLFTELNQADIRFIQIILKNLYLKWFKKEIDNNILSDFDSEKYPIFSNLVEDVKNYKCETDEEELRKKKVYEILNHNFIDSKLGNIYNGYSNVSLDDNLIIFDVQSIYNDDSASAVRAALYIIISRINNQLIINYRKSFDDRKKIIIFIDEAHLLLDKDNPITINFLHRTVKRIRKYNGGVVLTTQNPGDFADSGNDKKLSNILNNIQYSFLLKMRSNDVEAVSELYKSTGGLTEYEKKNLVRIPRGTCMFNPNHSIRKFIKLHYNEMEKRIAFANYQPEEFDDENNDDGWLYDDQNNNDKENEILLPKPLKAIYLFFKKKFNKSKGAKNE